MVNGAHFVEDSGHHRRPLYAYVCFRVVIAAVLDIHEIAAGKMVARVTRRAPCELLYAHWIIAMPSLHWAKIKAATLMIGAGAKSFDWRTASPEAFGCEVGDITGKLTMCLHDRYLLSGEGRMTLGPARKRVIGVSGLGMDLTVVLELGPRLRGRDQS